MKHTLLRLSGLSHGTFVAGVLLAGPSEQKEEVCQGLQFRLDFSCLKVTVCGTGMHRALSFQCFTSTSRSTGTLCAEAFWEVRD